MISEMLFDKHILIKWVVKISFIVLYTVKKQILLYILNTYWSFQILITNIFISIDTKKTQNIIPQFCIKNYLCLVFWAVMAVSTLTLKESNNSIQLSFEKRNWVIIYFVKLLYDDYLIIYTVTSIMQDWVYADVKAITIHFFNCKQLWL